MAALWKFSSVKNCDFTQHLPTLSRLFATKAEKKKGLDRKPTPIIDSTAQSLASKGFLRAQNAYNPPKDVNETLDKLFKQYLENFDENTEIKDLGVKAVLLKECFKQFSHGVPNSDLCYIKTKESIRKFYNTSVCTKTPLEKLKTMELPENLHVQYDYVRFHPDTDTKFGGLTAYNRRSTIVSGDRKSVV